MRCGSVTVATFEPQVTGPLSNRFVCAIKGDYMARRRHSPTKTSKVTLFLVPKRRQFTPIARTKVQRVVFLACRSESKWKMNSYEKWKNKKKYHGKWILAKLKSTYVIPRLIKNRDWPTTIRIKYSVCMTSSMNQFQPSIGLNVLNGIDTVINTHEGMNRINYWLMPTSYVII